MGGRPAPGAASGIGRGAALLLAAAILMSATAALILTRHHLAAGLAAAAGAAALMIASAWGWPASSRRERFACRILDFLFEAAVLVPLAWVNRTASRPDAVLALVGLGASYVASYERAKGQALGYRAVEGMAYLRTRYAILVLTLLTGWFTAGLLVYAVLTVAAAATRAWNVARQERHSPSTDGALR